MLRFAVDIHLIQGMLQGDGFCVTIKAQTVLMVRLDSSRIWQVVGAPKLNKSCILRSKEKVGRNINLWVLCRLITHMI